jgi:hypothetical protein
MMIGEIDKMTTTAPMTTGLGIGDQTTEIIKIGETTEVVITEIGGTTVETIQIETETGTETETTGKCENMQ